MDCPLKQDADGSWTCPNCGWTYHKEARRRCLSGDDPMAAGLRLIHALSEMASNGLASRCMQEMGRLLARCQDCTRFTAAAGCTAFDGEAGRPNLLDVLTDNTRWCPHWGRK